MNHDKFKHLPDGVYSDKDDDGEHRLDKIKGVWFYADGTGWTEPFESRLFNPKINTKPDILPDYEYGPMSKRASNLIDNLTKGII